MASVEQHSSDDGIVWPSEIAPFDIHVVPVNLKDEDQKTLSDGLYKELKAQGFDVLIDDRNERAGVKFKDADLIGIPVRIVVGKDAKEGKVEVIKRTKNIREVVLVSDIATYL